MMSKLNALWNAAEATAQKKRFLKIKNIKHKKRFLSTYQKDLTGKSKTKLLKSIRKIALNR